jgi:glutamate 5-kinase
MNKSYARSILNKLGGFYMRRSELINKDRIVIKIGSSSITHSETGHISILKMEKFVRQIADLKNSGKEVVIVSSGAQAVGLSTLNLTERPTNIEGKQAVAAVGQASLMMLYQKLFSEYNNTVGQILITKDLLEHCNRKKNAINTFNELLHMGVIPIVNENDTVSTEEIEFGDNDTLSAIVSELIDADLLILLSDIDGLYDSDPNNNCNAQLIDKVKNIDYDIEKMATGSKSKVGTGGMSTKIQAAKIATSNGIDMIIANANTEHVIDRIIEGEVIGTIFWA